MGVAFANKNIEVAEKTYLEHGLPVQSASLALDVHPVGHLTDTPRSWGRNLATIAVSLCKSNCPLTGLPVPHVVVFYLVTTNTS